MKNFKLTEEQWDQLLLMLGYATGAYARIEGVSPPGYFLDIANTLMQQAVPEKFRIKKNESEV